MKILGLKEAAEMLRISPDCMRDLAADGSVPGAKIGKEWVFLEEELEEYLRSEIKKQTLQRRGELEQRLPSAYARTVRHRPAPPPKF